MCDGGEWSASSTSSSKWASAGHLGKALLEIPSIAILKKKNMYFNNDQEKIQKISKREIDKSSEENLHISDEDSNSGSQKLPHQSEGHYGVTSSCSSHD